MVRLPLRAGAVDRSVWPIAAPLARVADLLRVDLADVTDAAERVAPYITADGPAAVVGEADRAGHRPERQTLA